MLASYDFELVYKPGRENSVPDALSRAPHHITTMLTHLRVPGNCCKVTCKLEDSEDIVLDGEALQASGSVHTSRIIHANAMHVTQLETTLLDHCRAALHSDKWIAQFLPYLENVTMKRPRNVSSQLRGMYLSDGLVWKGERDKTPRLYLPTEELRVKILKERHEASLAGHLGQDKTVHLIARDFFFPSMQEFICRFVCTCDTCQRVKPH